MPSSSKITSDDLDLLVFGFGPNIDPLEHFKLGAYWPEFPQDAVLDNAVYSELDPAEAPSWTLTRSMRPKFHHPLTETLCKVITAYMLSNEIEFSPDTLDPDLQSGSKVFDSVGTTLNTVVRRNNAQAPNYVQTVLGVLFSAPQEVSSDFYGPSLLAELNLAAPDQITPFFGKVAPKGSLAWLIALHVSNEIHDPEMKNLAALWNEIVKEIRLHYENGILLERVEEGAPNLKYNLLHQKLQMINVCIRKKRQSQGGDEGRRRPQREIRALFDPDPRGSHTSDTEEDVFYDTLDSPDDDVLKTPEPSTPPPTFADSEGREGLKRPLGDSVFCQNGRLLFIPETQDAAPLTEDLLEEQQRLFEEMGTSSEAAVVRQKLQSAQLRSDMEAFKAANPGAVLEDFVRWHSPRDWVAPKEGQKATVSGRMQEEGNLWMETWKVAESIPAHRQKPLFHFDQEAMKVLHYLENMMVDALIEQ